MDLQESKNGTQSAFMNLTALEAAEVISMAKASTKHKLEFTKQELHQKMLKNYSNVCLNDNVTNITNTILTL